MVKCPDPLVFGPPAAGRPLTAAQWARGVVAHMGMGDELGARLEAELEAAELAAAAEQAAEAAEITHVSLRCRLYAQYGQAHTPCSGTCDGHGSGIPCDRPCSCSCHGRGLRGTRAGSHLPPSVARPPRAAPPPAVPRAPTVKYGGGAP